MKKRILSIMLALVMIVSLLPVGTFAAEAKCPGATVDHTKANCDYVLYEAVAPTCSGFGYIVNKCLGCDTLFVTDITENKGECNADGVVAHKDATCTEPGVVGGTYCTVCEDGKAEAEAAIQPGHTYDFDAETDCTKGYPCIVCGEFSEPEAHTWVLAKIEEDPSHMTQKPGTAIYACSVCGATKEVDILVHAHDFSVPAEKAPSCFETGVLAGTMKCAFCDTWQYDDNGRTRTTTDLSKISLPMVAHTEPATGVEITPADCITKTNGLKKYTCTVCNEEQEEVLKWEDAHVKTLLDHVDPTCTEYGFDVWGCVLCSANFTDVLDPEGHTPTMRYGYPVYVNKTYADCDTDGYTGDVMCSECGEIAVKGETVPATGHTDVQVNKPANCVSVSMSYVACSYCDEVLSEITYGTELNPEVHADTSTKDYSSSVAANCCTDGIEYHMCDRCGETWEVELPKLNHNKSYGGTYMTYVRTVDPTCTEEGYELWECSYWNCDYTDENGNPATYTEKRNTTEKLTHKSVYDIFELMELEDNGGSFSFMNEIRAVSCDVDGLYAMKCNDCGCIFLMTVPAFHTIPTDGNGDEIYTEAPVDATCDQPGFTGSYVCDDCGEEIEGEEIPALGHDWEEHVNAADNDCVNDGSYEGGFCGECQNWLKREADGSYTVVADEDALVIPARGHWLAIVDKYWAEDFDADTEPGYLYKHYECLHGCGHEYISADFHRHVWVEDEALTVVADCTTADSKTYKCECGRIKVEVGTALGHTVEDTCANDGEKCDRCDFVVDNDHDFGNWNHVDANCSEGEHEIRFCADCDAYEVNPISEDKNPNNHVYGNPVYVEGSSVYVEHCVYCGVKSPEKMVEYTADVREDDLTVGSIVTVDVIMNANDINIWGFDIDVLFDNTILKFINAEAGENFSINFKNNGFYIGVAGNANGKAAVITDVVVTLTFEVLQAEHTDIEVVHNTTATPEGERVRAVVDFNSVCVDVWELGDVNKDTYVDILDVLAIYNFFMGIDGEFSELGDLNGDGSMDTIDMEMLYEIIVGMGTWI